MKTRMEKYYNNDQSLGRSQKNIDLYNQDNDVKPSTNVDLLDNESVIDVSKIKELFDSREGYQRIKKYDKIIETKEEEPEEDYDIYEDIENKIYDINSILDDARKKRVTNDDKEQSRKLRNTQYNILTQLELNDSKIDASNEDLCDEMASDFFTKDKAFKKLIEIDKKENNEPVEISELSSPDLFADLKSHEDTVLTEPIKEENMELKKPIEEIPNSINKENTFYTNTLSFTKQDFDEFYNLQSTVKSNNKLIKALIIFFVLILLAIVALIAYNFFQ
ncbi:MAG: hypothetical protein PHQ89_02945 [Bacilli bacterium]|nr:hypothetical protein [Bacilli bacterium]